MDFRYTEIFFDSMYLVNNPQGRRLRLGDIVIVHPELAGENFHHCLSEPREPYAGMICTKFQNWSIDPCIEIVMQGINGVKYGAVINELLFPLLEPIKWAYHKDLAKNKKPQKEFLISINR